MTPREFLEAVVRPNVDDFHTDFANLRHAHNAISAVDALAAHLYVWATTHDSAAVASRDDNEYRDKLAGRNQNFALLRDLAKAQKHVHLTRGKPQISHAAQVTSRSIGYGEGDYGAGHYGGPEQVIVEIDAGGFAYVESVVDDGLVFLEAEMHRLGA
jgi:hypothetical protein